MINQVLKKEKSKSPVNKAKSKAESYLEIFLTIFTISNNTIDLL